MACVPMEETGRAAGTLGHKITKFVLELDLKESMLDILQLIYIQNTQRRSLLWSQPRDLETFILQLSQKLYAKKEIFDQPYSWFHLTKVNTTG